MGVTIRFLSNFSRDYCLIWYFSDIYLYVSISFLIDFITQSILIYCINSKLIHWHGCWKQVSNKSTIKPWLSETHLLDINMWCLVSQKDYWVCFFSIQTLILHSYMSSIITYSQVLRFKGLSCKSLPLYIIYLIIQMNNTWTSIFKCLEYNHCN